MLIVRGDCFYCHALGFNPQPLGGAFVKVELLVLRTGVDCGLASGWVSTAGVDTGGYPLGADRGMLFCRRTATKLGFLINNDNLLSVINIGSVQEFNWERSKSSADAA